LDGALARERGDMPELVTATADSLRLLAEVPPAQLPTAGAYRAIALNNAGVGLFWMGRLGQAETRLRPGMAVAQTVGAELTQLNALSHLALLEAEQGNLHSAHQHAGAARELASAHGWRATLQVVPAYVAMALVNLEWHRLDEADAALQEGFSAQHADPEPIQRAALRVTQVRVLLARREVDAARLVTERAMAEIDAARMAPVLARWLAVADAELELSAGRPDEVLSRVSESTPGPSAIPRLGLCAARAHLALGAPQAADAALAPLRHSAPDLGSVVETWLLTALTEDALRQDGRSIDAFARAIALAEPENMRRPFIGIGHPRVVALLERHRWLVPQESPFVTALLAAVTSDHAVTDLAMVIDELTDRELDVLRYLPTMLRNHDIAADMHVSINTVKAHLRSIYRKLGVTRRREAVDRARELGLL